MVKSEAGSLGASSPFSSAPTSFSDMSEMEKQKQLCELFQAQLAARLMMRNATPEDINALVRGEEMAAALNLKRTPDGTGWML